MLPAIVWFAATYVLMIAGTMGLVQLFIDSRMPDRLADIIMSKVPNVQWAATAPPSAHAHRGVPCFFGQGRRGLAKRAEI